MSSGSGDGGGGGSDGGGCCLLGAELGTLKAEYSTGLGVHVGLHVIGEGRLAKEGATTLSV
jgi:hypothetical protein